LRSPRRWKNRLSIFSWIEFPAIDVDVIVFHAQA
jgi:hypothetical protein